MLISSRIISFLSAFSLLLSASFPNGLSPVNARVEALAPASEFDAASLFRAVVQVDNQTMLKRITDLGVVMLKPPVAPVQFPVNVSVAVSGDQLERLVRAGLRPATSDELGLLMSRNGKSNTWIATALKGVMNRSQTARARLNSKAADAKDAVTQVNAELQKLNAEVKNAINGLTSIDDDVDGLTNTQETWWCTNPLNTDSDGDGANDALEVQQAKDWVGNKRASYSAYGKPFLNWPMQDNGGNNPNCPDSDRDGVPDWAETWELGLNPNKESTDGDKFDDGQELFGITIASWGLLPRNEDTNFIGTNMPSWIKTPGNHPFVSAYPLPDIEVLESPFKLTLVTTITSDTTLTSGTEQLRSTTVLTGSSTSDANSETWEDWQSVANTTAADVNQLTSTIQQGPFAIRAVKPKPRGNKVNTTNFNTSNFTSISSKQTSYEFNTEINQLSQMGSGINPMSHIVERGTDAVIDETCAELNCKKYLGSAVRAGARGIINAGADIWQNLTGQGKCNGFGLDNVKCVFSSAGNKLLEIDDLYKERIAAVEQEELNEGSQAAGNYLYRDGDQLVGRSVYPISFPVPSFTPTRTETQGSSHGGSHTVTNSEYKEHSFTEGQTFLSSTAWSTATAQNTAHAADLQFNYSIKNKGTDYALNLCNVMFSVYLGDEDQPIYSYAVAPDLGGDGCFHNFQPDEKHSYASRAVPLTLNQLKQIDTGDSMRFIVEDFSYGNDELFYEDARTSGVLVAIEDGTDDGNEAIDTYLIPTWGDGDTMQDVLGRYFPSQQDSDGNFIAIWTPENIPPSAVANSADGAQAVSAEPSWCVEPRRASPIAAQVWCKHALSTSDWWNIYLNNLGDGTTQLNQTLAAPNSTAFFRFNKDTDLDGYSDRTEQQLGTDPLNAASHPKPELLAGVNRLPAVNNVVTATASLLNTGLYDAYGTELIMVAPDDSITVLNNTVGGSGRVKAGKQVVVGSSTKVPALAAAWTQTGHAKPSVGGYYTGGVDRIYTFTAMCANPGGCDVGNASNAPALNWTDGVSATGIITFGSSYNSPNLIDVGTQGVKLSMQSGKIYNGETFTMTANTPRDTFSYRINRTPYTDPLVIVSYNDPQGNHRFIIPTSAMSLITPTQNLAPFSGQMLQDPGVEIATTAPFTPTGAQSVTLVINNPSGVTLTNAHVFVEFVNISGTVAAEFPATVTLPAGPGIVAVNWNTAVFSPAFQSGEDYIVMAFFTDYQGNILDTGGRPLSSFQQDPKPVFAMGSADQIWNFGTAAQGTLLKRIFTFGNVGLLDLLTYVNGVPGLSLSQTGSRKVGPADVTSYEMALNTQGMAVGPYDQTITIRTSDPAQPTQTVHIVGTVSPALGNTQPGPLLRPLDVDVTVNSGNAGDWVTFSHALGPDPQTLHPVKIFDANYAALQGVGKYATDFSAGTASADMFGDGRDGVMPSSGNLDNANGAAAGIVNSGNAGSTGVNVSDAYGISRIKSGDVVLIHQTQGTGAGNWELNKAANDFTGNGTFSLRKALQFTYASGGNNRAQILRVPQYTTCNVTGTVTPLAAWNGNWGGITSFLCKTSLSISGSLDVRNQGFRGGLGETTVSNTYADPRNRGQQGESHLGLGADDILTANGGGGGGGKFIGGGGGGGYAVGGNNAINGYYTDPEAQGGQIYGLADLSVIHLGSGAGGGGVDSNWGNRGYDGGGGAGIVVAYADQLQVTGQILGGGSNAVGNGYGVSGGGGGGAGGSILLRGKNVVVGNSLITALGGAPNSGYFGTGGAGGAGRIRLEYCDSVSGSTNPAASAQKLNCYAVEQVETSPYTQGRLNLPTSISSATTFRVQYGRKLGFSAAGSLTTTLRISSGLVNTATIQALVSGLNANSPFALDVGDDGSTDWSGSVANNSQNSSPDLASAFNAYWATHGSPTTGTLDVPVRVILGAAGQVLLTNMQMSMATGVTAASLNPPLDVDVTVTGTQSQGTWWTYSHALGPNPDSLHPVKVYNTAYSTLYGAGRYATDFAPGTASGDMFGDGRDGAMPGSGNLDNNNGFGAAVVNSASQGSTSINVTDVYAGWRINPGDYVLIHQTQGTGAGNWELNKAATDYAGGTATFQLVNPLKNTYYAGGNNHAQIQRVPQYSSCNVTGTITPPTPWNGTWGGILAVMCNNTMNISGSLFSNGYGFRGGSNSTYNSIGGQQGEGIAQIGSNSGFANMNGGGGGGQSPGGGGGNGTPGVKSIWGSSPGAGGNSVGAVDLSNAVFGGGGGGAAWEGSNPQAGKGGNGAGFIAVFAKSIFLNGFVQADGNAGETSIHRGGGGGAGGSILIRINEGQLGNGLTHSYAGPEGGGTGTSDSGGAGGLGRIRIEYCNNYPIGITNPSASTQKLTCYIAAQVESSPYTQGRLNLPEAVNGSKTYKVQYGRKLTFASSGNQLTYLRMSAGMFSNVTMQSLVSGLSANTAFSLDIGDDGSTEWGSTVANISSNNSPDLSAAFNAYWSSHGAPQTGALDVPIRVALGGAGQVLLTNVQVQLSGNPLRFVRLPARAYSNVAINYTLTNGSGPMTIAADVGDNSTVDWTTTGSVTFPYMANTGDLSSAVNAYLSGKTGEVDVPIRFYVSPSNAVLSLNSFTATPSQLPDATSAAGNITFSNVSIVQSDSVTVTASISSTGASETTGLIASFSAVAPGVGPIYIGSAYVPALAAGGSAQVSVPWNTLGFTGSVPVRLTLDPTNRVTETNESNNAFTATVNVLTRPDLRVQSLALSDDEPVVSETVTVTAVVKNAGQTAAPSSALGVYMGNPDAGGALINTQSSSIGGGGQVTLTFTWTPTQTGAVRLFARADRAHQVSESDASNNDLWIDRYVGFAGPRALDSGNLAGEAAYTTTTGYGYVDEGQPDAIGSCGAGNDQTYRRDPGGKVVYRFDNMQPGRFYHLDLALYECGTGVGRQEYIKVDGNTIGGPVDLGNGQINRVSYLLDPALYADRAISVSVEEYGGNGAIVNSIALREVDYRYADAGGGNDPAYPGTRGYGWVDTSSTTSSSCGSLPYQTARVDQSDNELRYRYDNLDPVKQYRLKLTFYQCGGTTVQQEIRFDGTVAGSGLSIAPNTYVSATRDLPLIAYLSDHSVTVSIVRTNAGANAMVSEIALEENTLPAVGTCSVRQSQYQTQAYGSVLIEGQPAPAGATVTALNPRGDIVGCWSMDTAGQYGLMTIYGEDTSVSPAIPGMRDGEPVLFKVEGVDAVSTPALYWTDDSASHQINLNAVSLPQQSILLPPQSWNLFSFRMEPPTPAINNVLGSIAGQYCKVHGEAGVYDCAVPPQYQSLTEVHTKPAYWIYITNTATSNLVVKGTEVAANTPIPLHAGWNWVGYLPPASMPITTALQSIAGKFSKAINSGSQTYDVNLLQFSSLWQMTPGLGYQIYMTQPATLVYPVALDALELDMPQAPQKAQGTCSGSAVTPFFTQLYGSVALNGAPAPVGTKIEAVTPDGVVAGCWEMDASGQYGLVSVFGDDGGSVRGFTDGQRVYVRVNGGSLIDTGLDWTDDNASHRFDVSVTSDVRIYLPLLQK